MERRPAPRVVIHPGPPIVVFPDPLAIGIGRPARLDIRRPYIAIRGVISPSSIGVEILHRQDQIDRRDITVQGSVKLTGALSHLEQGRRRFEHPGDSRSMGWFRRLVSEALLEIAVEDGGANLKQKMGAAL